MIERIYKAQDWLDIIPQMHLLTLESAEDEKNLHCKSGEVTIFGKELEQFCKAMVKKMLAENGIGLAAPQLGIFQRIFVLQTAEEQPPMLVINPIISPVSKNKIFGEEGCLSVPGIYADVKRWPVIDITAQNPYGKLFKLRLDGIDSICFQHENDHLEGVIFTDYLTRSQMKRIKKYFSEQSEQVH